MVGYQHLVKAGLEISQVQQGPVSCAYMMLPYREAMPACGTIKGWCIATRGRHYARLEPESRSRQSLPLEYKYGRASEPGFASFRSSSR